MSIRGLYSFVSHFNIYRRYNEDSVYAKKDKVSRVLGWLVIGVLIFLPYIQQSTLSVDLKFGIDSPLHQSSPHHPGSPTDSSTQAYLFMDVEVSHIPCMAVGFNIQTTTGNTLLYNPDHLKKFRIIPENPEPLVYDGKRSVIHKDGDKMVRSRKPEDTDETCGGCYGAAEINGCCDSCDDVLYAYRLKQWALPAKELIKQCQLSKDDGTAVAGSERFGPLDRFGGQIMDEAETSELLQHQSEGCRIVGMLEISKAPIQVHLTAGGVKRFSFIDAIEKKTNPSFGLSNHLLNQIIIFDHQQQERQGQHSIKTILHSLSAGTVPDTQRGVEPIHKFADDGMKSHQYYVTFTKFTDIKDETSYHSSYKYFAAKEDMNGVGLHFKINFDPIAVTEVKLFTWYDFLVDWLGLLGGLISLGRILSF